MKLLSIVLSLMMGLTTFAQNIFTSNNSVYHDKLWGVNTFVFDPSMDMGKIQTLIDSIHSGLIFPEGEFSKQRYAYLFKPGVYHLDVKVGYYTHVIGLGQSPADVTIVGSVRSNSHDGTHVLCNFWRSAENLTIQPTSPDTTNTWAASQASPLRKVHVKGNLQLFEGASSGGFMADCKVDGTVVSGSQQQFFSRNCEFGNWDGGVWNMVYVGVEGSPQENWPLKPVTVVDKTPEVKEKPYWVYKKGKYYLKVPSVKRNSRGVSDESLKEKMIPIDRFYIVQPGASSQSINNALSKGKHILFSPGIYHLDSPIKVTRPNAIVMGIGLASLVPTHGNMVIEVADEPGITISSLMIDASLPASDVLMMVGGLGANKNHASNPIYLYDTFFRVGGPHQGITNQCLVINSNNVIVDHAWLWRADHGNGVAWDKNKAANGLVVNGNQVTVYALFNEHFQEYQTIWNGEQGRVYMYQSEMPYDPTAPELWKHGNTYGYASYKVADDVKTHHAWGVGIYNVFFDAPIIVDQAIETPVAIEDSIYHKVIFWLNGNKESVVKSIINGKGGQVDHENRKQTMK